MTLLQRVRRGLSLFRGQRVALVLAAIAIAVTAACEPLIPALMKPLLDRGFVAGGLSIWMVPVVVLLLFGVRGLSAFAAQYLLAYASNNVMKELRRQLFGKLLTARPTLFGSQSSSSLANTLVYEVHIGVTMLVSSVFSLTRDCLTLVALLGYLFYLNWKLTLIVAVIFPVVAVVVKVLARRLRHLTRASQGATDNLAYVVEENVLAWRMVRLQGGQADQHRRFENLSENLRRLAMKSTVASAGMSPVTQLLAALALAAVVTVALWESSQQGITVGGFAAFVTAMLMLMAPIKHLSEAATPITRSLAAIERGLDLLDTIEDESGGPHRVPRARGAIEMRQVRLRYPGAAEDALADIDLDLPAGQVVALVGSSGSGKSTLANLLPRFLVPDAGRILLDGVDLAQWDLAGLRSQIAYVSQDVVMFNDSLAANVALGQPMDEARVLDVLEAANLGAHVKSLPEGIHTVVGHNATQLSGGQRQRLAIARALYKDAPVLILDEATSALDTESERLVQQALARLMAGRTTLIIAHRLSTVEHADRIVVLDRGRIAEQGTHAELIARGGLYSRLHQSPALLADDAPSVAP